ncbi:1-deoxy-D-xylulose-5-phosphate synthase N-terminal domain-containing protein [Buchnera aphidicola]|uniref:1-deoxy-D-xylulose-5-phosphate synthase N-terminal domain-containing protein n=1 Tax=Buchnera aphidicola TaxID=9 RepID=UPI00030FB235|nr:1-deoxy-D-xylulose-5-phosphate synthase N-terminal domain-containing protein [Buchnera aphidicola]
MTCYTKIKYIKKIFKNIASSNTFFESLGLKCFGLLDGHDVYLLINVLNRLKIKSNIKLLHIKTKRGKNYLLSELNSMEWYSVPKFSVSSVKFYTSKSKIFNYSKVFGNFFYVL